MIWFLFVWNAVFIKAFSIHSAEEGYVVVNGVIPYPVRRGKPLHSDSVGNENVLRTRIDYDYFSTVSVEEKVYVSVYWDMMLPSPEPMLEVSVGVRREDKRHAFSFSTDKKSRAK